MTNEVIHPSCIDILPKLQGVTFSFLLDLSGSSPEKEALQSDLDLFVFKGSSGLCVSSDHMLL